MMRKVNIEQDGYDKKNIDKNSDDEKNIKIFMMCILKLFFSFDK